jgi:hypothetical protein
MAKYRTAQGKTLDMSALAAKNEKVRAVGIGAKVNARGDIIDGTGKIIKPATQKVSEEYAKTVGNRSANVKKASKQLKPDVQLTEEERQLEEALNDDIEVEKIKAKEKK